MFQNKHVWENITPILETCRPTDDVVFMILLFIKYMESHCSHLNGFGKALCFYLLQCMFSFFLSDIQHYRKNASVANERQKYNVRGISLHVIYYKQSWFMIVVTNEVLIAKINRVDLRIKPNRLL